MVTHDAKLTLDRLAQHYIKVSETDKANHLTILLDLLEFNQV